MSYKISGYSSTRSSGFKEMEKRQNTAQRNLQKLKQQSSKDVFLDKTWRKAILYNKQRCRSLHRNENYSSSTSDLEAETAFKDEYSTKYSPKSQALRRVFDKSRSPKKRIPRKKALGKGCPGRNSGNTKITSSVNSYKIYKGFCPSILDNDEENESGICSSAASRESSSNESYNVLIDEEGMNTNPNNLYHESCTEPKILTMDSLHACKILKQENHRASTFHERKNQRNNGNVPSHALKHYGNLSKTREAIGKEARNLRECKKMNLSLSQKYSPQTFKELVGQSIITKSLMNAIQKGKIAPIYLLHGPRGTGKTSAARIFASALKCLSANFESKPCWKCRECSLFRYGKSAHIVEVNAASNSGIEKMKLFLDSVEFCQSVSGYKIIIVEECHVLTPQTWSGTLLKSLENPIDFVVFILITTDSDMLPKTSLSRCQKFSFQKLKDIDVFNRLQKLAVAENIDIEEDALRLIATRSDGSLREAETTLEQFSLLAAKVSLSMVCQMIGLIPHEKLVNLLDSALSADTENTVKSTREIIDSGIEPLALVSQLATLIAEILANSCVSERVQETRRFFSGHYLSKDKTEKLGRALKLLAEVEKKLRASNDSTCWLTAALLQFAPDELHLNPQSAVGTRTIQINDSLGKEITDIEPTEGPCHSEEQWEVYEVPLEIVSAKHPKMITNKDSDIAISSGIICGFTESSMGHFHDSNMGHSHKLDAIVEDHGAVAGSDNLPASAINYSRVSEAGKMELNPVSPSEMEQIWQNVLKSSQSTTLKKLLKGRGKLVSLLVSKANAIAYLEFTHPRHKAKAERLEATISNALQEVLACPVEVKLAFAPSSSIHESSKGTDVLPNNREDTLYCEENQKLSATKTNSSQKSTSIRCILPLFRGRKKIVGSLSNPKCMNQSNPGNSKENGRAQSKEQIYEGQFEDMHIAKQCPALKSYGNEQSWSRRDTENSQMHQTSSTSNSAFSPTFVQPAGRDIEAHHEGFEFDQHANFPRKLASVTDSKPGTTSLKEKELDSHPNQNIESELHTRCGSLFCWNQMQIKVKHIRWGRRRLQFLLKFVPCMESSVCVFGRRMREIHKTIILPRCFSMKCC
eukprot:Gb_06112 [translate_table: standard]